MTQDDKPISVLLYRLYEYRKESGMTCSQAEKQLDIGQNWVEWIENGLFIPDLEMIGALVSLYQKTLTDLFQDLPNNVIPFKRQITAKENKNNLEIHFRYAKHDAVYSPSFYVTQCPCVRNHRAEIRNPNHETTDVQIMPKLCHAAQT